MTISWRARQRTTASAAVQSYRLVPITDARTGRTHLVNDEAMTAGRRAGRYLTVCGVEALAASLTTEADTFCKLCRSGRADDF